MTVEAPFFAGDNVWEKLFPNGAMGTLVIGHYLLINTSPDCNLLYEYKRKIITSRMVVMFA